MKKKLKSLEKFQLEKLAIATKIKGGVDPGPGYVATNEQVNIGSTKITFKHDVERICEVCEFGHSHCP